MTDLSKSPPRIAAMFDRIAPRYDLLNHLLSAGIDRRWRKRAVSALALTGRERVLDLCTGTADLALAAVRAAPPARRVVGVDLAGAMLRVASGKLQHDRLADRIRLVRGSATSIPLGRGSVDAVTVAFGIRNVEDPVRACGEIHRVLRPGGRAAILEFAMPRSWCLGPIYRGYFNHVLPRVGRIVSADASAYGYLSASVNAFRSPDELVEMLRQAGFVEVSAVRLTFGIVYLYAARKG